MAILTIEDLASSQGQEVVVFEDLKEKTLSQAGDIVSDQELHPHLESMFLDPAYPLPGGESNQDCQKRAVAVLNKILGDYQGHKIAIGTHGIVMTLMMGYFESRYGSLEFLMQTSKPDIYRMEFEEERLIEVRRLWDGDEKALTRRQLR